MAGANNAQLKAAGWKARDVTKARAERGKLSHAAMDGAGYQPRKGYEPVSRGKADAKPSGAPAGWQAAAKGEGREGRQAATAARAAFVQRQAEERGKARRANLAGRGLRDVAGAMMASRKAAAQEAAGKARRADLAKRGAQDLAATMLARRKPDPHAEKRARIANLEEQLATGKAVNKIIRAEQRKGGNWEERAVGRLTKETRATEKQAQMLVKPDFVGRYGVPDYEFTNKGATIRRLKDEIGMARPRGKKWEDRMIRGIGSFGPGAVRLK